MSPAALRRWRAAAVIAVAVTAGACTVGPDWKRPAPAMPAAFRIAPDEGTTIANVRWWQALGDPVLDALIADAVRDNRDLLQAAARVDQFLGALRVTRSQFYPQLGYSGSAGVQRLSETGQPPLAPGADRNVDLYSAALGATWQIDLFGRVRRLAEQAQAQVYASEQGRRGVVLSVVASVATGYIGLRALDRQLEIAREAAHAYGQSVDVFEMRFRGGMVSEVELVQARSLHEQALAAIPSLERQVAQQEHLLSIVTGRAPGAIPRGRPIEALTPPPIPAALPSALLERRPDILAAEERLRAAGAAIGAARALYFPTLSLTGALGVASTALGDVTSRGSDTASLAAGLAGPIFTSGRIEGQVAAAEAARTEAQAFYEAVVLGALRETEDALVGVRTRTLEQASLERRVQALRRYAQLSTARFEGGVTSWLEVLYAENELFGADLAAVSGRAQRLAESVNVWKALGGGWIDAVDPRTAPTDANPVTTATSGGTAAPPADASSPSAAATSASDRLHVVREGAASVVDIERVVGRGAIEVRLPARGATGVVLRFRAFATAPAVDARSASARLACDGGRCQLDGRAVEGWRRTPDGFELPLPTPLLPGPGATAEVRWAPPAP
ncbi:MAG: efflux transporter outer membrane subunit [Burkholderiales bacterium]|nr:efflux transporter outer membrane subunit [Burkholderiales bacterium]